MVKNQSRLVNHFVNLVTSDQIVMNRDLMKNITDNSIVFLAVMSVPLNIIVYLALSESEYFAPRLVVPFFSLLVVFLAFFRKKINYRIKIFILNVIFFLGAVFTLLLGLLDMASLWFVLTMIYTLFISRKKGAVSVFFAGLLLMIITGYLLIMKNSFIPLKYNFENCHYACVITRIIHYMMIGFLIFYIISSFLDEIKQNMIELQDKANDLENVNLSLQKEMENNRQMQQNMLETVILTEEKERKRIAADLHDGLGPVLSSINLYYQAYIDEQKPLVKQQIEKKLKLIIDNAVSEVSRISHNISPVILEHNGLFIALENFINQLSIKKDLHIDFSYQNMERFDIKKELVLYRALIELINNSIKHAKAGLINITIKPVKNFIHITYTDNGKGFDKSELKNNNGMGLTNIKNRMQSLEGFFSFETSPGKGFQALLQLPYN